ncbi:DUF6292 family protein [Actinophytocola sp.]|uniref:DUF6292 family protein n=1 Tax=Actinophytocola sp. TaxID=1872138 RepID=UPI003899BC8A
MTSSPRSHFVEARARAEQERTEQRRRAARTVASKAHDRTEFTALLAMLGLTEPASHPAPPAPLSAKLGVYVDHVAAAIGVPGEATGYEVTDTATAYLALDQRSPSRPDHDLMLVWDERLGWYIAAETTPTEAPAVLAYLNGDTVPSPTAVAQFVTDTAAGRPASRIRPVLPPTERTALAEKMAAVC